MAALRVIVELLEDNSLSPGDVPPCRIRQVVALEILCHLSFPRTLRKLTPSPRFRKNLPVNAPGKAADSLLGTQTEGVDGVTLAALADRFRMDPGVLPWCSGGRGCSVHIFQRSLAGL